MPVPVDGYVYTACRQGYVDRAREEHTCQETGEWTSKPDARDKAV